MANPSFLIDRLIGHEMLNVLVTNFIPRRAVSRLMARFSRIEQPLVYRWSMVTWQFFGGRIDLHEAKKSRFVSVHDCFVRELRDGARPIDPDPAVVVSPCDAVVGVCGRVRDQQMIQAKGISYRLEDLILDPTLVRAYRDGVYATLRLTSTMYHRFHAPCAGRVGHVLYVPGDAWNVTPGTLRRVPGVFCRNERAVISATIDGSRESLLLVAVAAILVGGIHLEFVDTTFNLGCRQARRLRCDTTHRKGEELGHFCHGSTIIVLGTAGLTFLNTVQSGHIIRQGQPLFRVDRSF
jgi:phosphatidylserine decarboxylase